MSFLRMIMVPTSISVVAIVYLHGLGRTKTKIANPARARRRPRSHSKRLFISNRRRSAAFRYGSTVQALQPTIRHDAPLEFIGCLPTTFPLVIEANHALEVGAEPDTTPDHQYNVDGTHDHEMTFEIENRYSDWRQQNQEPNATLNERPLAFRNQAASGIRAHSRA